MVCHQGRRHGLENPNGEGRHLCARRRRRVGAQRPDYGRGRSGSALAESDGQAARRS